ncbi:MAG: FRG domain-containing protein, partial [Deltaproteobacteria bacterium]|nr:FRG domain-containing protein [Deltaproteobacteria bacterium]
WGLETEFERSVNKFAPKAKDYPKLEGGLIRLFKRQFRQFGLPSPGENDFMEWLAVMRHYGAPTRILDWTYSFYPALFFAVEEAKAESAVWALDTKWTDRQCKEKYPTEWKLVETDGSDPNARCFKTFKEVFLAKKSFVINMNSYNQNQRLVIQQGTFLCPGNIEASFEENLLALADGKSLDSNVVKYVITGDAEERREILKRLHRMNMNRATLFPGLDGFAQSLKTRILFPQLLLPDPKWQSWLEKKR